MLTREQNATLTQTGPGTPCGELMRRYWQPVALSSEIPVGSRSPVPVTILGEELVLFRDASDRLGLIELHCQHRGADLSYGFVDACGLRCLYHNWAYDVHGHCTDQPGQASATFKAGIRAAAYPCVDVGGIVLAYLGPDEPPVVPRYGFSDVPAESRIVQRILLDCNYLQANEGNIDPHHVGFLHAQPGTELFNADLAPRMSVEDTSFGVRITMVRSLPGEQEYVRRSNFIMPNLSSFTLDGHIEDGFSIHWHVPVTDTSHWKYLIAFERGGPLGPPADWTTEIDEFHRLERNRSNRYLQDRSQVGSRVTAGMGSNFQAHDAFATESQGHVQDRTREHLTAMDLAITRSRKCLFNGIEAVRAGRDPQHVLRPPSDGAVPDLITDSAVVAAGAHS